MKRTFKLFTALAILLLMLSSLMVFASLEEPSKPDVYIAKSTGAYKTFFPDIVNVPASVYENEPNGKLVVVYQEATSHSTTSDDILATSTLKQVESTDNGKSWSEPVTIIDQAKLVEWGISSAEKIFQVRDPNLALLNDGTVLLTFWRTATNDGSQNVVYMCESTDGCQSWGTPIAIPCTKLDATIAKRGDIAVFPDNSNQILIPVYGRASDSASSMDTDAVIILATKTANGWTFDAEYTLAESDISNNITFNEASLVAVDKNTVYAMTREVGYLYKSTDRGATWTQIADDDSVNHQQPGIKLMPDGSMFFTWSVHAANGRPVYAKMFRPEYKWENIPSKIVYISPRGNSDIADPSSILTNDGKLLVVYYDAGDQFIGGTFSEISDWEVPEIDMNFTSRTILHTEDAESGTVGKAFNSAYFYKVGTGATAGINVSEVDGSKVIDFYDLSAAGYPRLMSNATITGNYTVTADVKFETFESVTFNFTHAEGGPTFQLNGNVIQVVYQGVIKSELPLVLETGTWYKMKFSRVGNAVFAKVWSGTEPTEWSIKYTLPVDVVENQMRFSYYSGVSNSHAYVDNIVVSRAMEIKLPETLEVMDGTSATLSYEIFPKPIENITITYTSSNTAVATVTSTGVITPHMAGETTITVSGAGMSAECKVTVIEQKLEASNRGEQVVFWEENLEDNEVGTFTTSDFSQYITAERASATVVEEAGNKILRMTGELVTGNFHHVNLYGYKYIYDDYTMTVDFRFNSATVNAVDGGQTISFGVQHATGNYLVNVKTDKITFTNNSGKVQCELAREYTPGVWYTARISRAGDVIYGRTWVKGDPEPSDWDVSYTGVDIGKAGTMRVSYSTSCTAYFGGGQSADFDNLSASRRATVNINDTYITGRAGDTQQLFGVVAPDILSKSPAISASWSSDNEAVATVNQTGRVTFVAPGTATITYKVGLKTVKTCTAVVSQGYKVGINKAATTAKIGTTETLFVVFNPMPEGTPTVDWASGDTTVATVDSNGKVSFVKAGVTYITATTDYGTAVCAVQVIDDTPTEQRAVEVTPKSVRATIGGQSVLLTASVTPTDASTVVGWISADESIVKVDAYGNLSFVGEGITYITASTVYGNAICPVVVDAVPEVSVSGNTLIIENYISGVTYAYTATPNAADSWTAFNSQRVTLPKANTLYYVKIMSGEGVSESAAIATPAKTEGIVFKGASLVLDGTIGMKLYFDIDTEVADLEKTVLTYTANGEGNSGKTTFAVGEDGRTATVMLYTPVKNMSTTYWETNLVYTDKDGNETDMGSLASKLDINTYITALKNLASLGNQDASAALGVVEAMETYSKYALNFFSNGEPLEDIEVEIGEITAPVKTGTIEGIEHYQTSLLLEETTSIRHYFRITDTTVLDTLEVTADGGTVVFDKASVESDENGAFIKIDIADIPAQELGTQYTMTLKSGDSTINVTYSALNYVSLTYAEGDSLAKLSKALYNYHTEAKAYEEYLEHRLDLEEDEDETQPDQW